MAVLRGFSWLCTEELLPVVLRGPDEMPGIKLSLAVSKAIPSPTILSFWPHSEFFFLFSSFYV